MPKTPPIDRKKLAGNPFVQNFKIEVNKGIRKGKFRDIGEGVKAQDHYFTERTRFVKLFLSKDTLPLTMNLSDRAMRLYFYIILNLEPGKEYVYIDPKEYLKEAHVKSLTTYKQAKDELIRYDFLAPSARSRYYFINPKLIFFGNRPDTFESNVIVRFEYEN